MSANPTIGMVTCPLCNEPAAVRKNKNGKFYYVSAAGLITPSNEFGQGWFVENAVIWGANGVPPDDVPEWIAEGKSFPANSQSRQRGSEELDEEKDVPVPAVVVDKTESQGLEHAVDLSIDTVPEPDDDDADDGLFGSFLGRG